MAASDDGSRLERLARYQLSPDDIDLQEVVVEEGDEVNTKELSTQTIEPESIEVVQDMLGVPDEDTVPLREGHVPSYIPAVEEIGSAMEEETQPAGSPDEPLSQVLESVLYRNTGGHGTISQWERNLAELETEGWIQPERFELFPAKDITIQNGARFKADDSTNVLFADTIEIHGDGELTYEGNLKIDCAKTVGKP
jgi:hypothetical protein